MINESINGVYYDGAWHYYAISDYSDKTKEEVSDTFFADAIWGIKKTETKPSDSDSEVIGELSRRYSAMGYHMTN